MIALVAVGRDDLHHAAEAFDITRATRRTHLSFGHGPDVCLGAYLARIETEVALQRLLDRFPHLTLTTDDVPYVPSILLHGVKALPVDLGRRSEQIPKAA